MAQQSERLDNLFKEMETLREEREKCVAVKHELDAKRAEQSSQINADDSDKPQPTDNSTPSVADLERKIADNAGREKTSAREIARSAAEEFDERHADTDPDKKKDLQTQLDKQFQLLRDRLEHPPPPTLQG